MTPHYSRCFCVAQERHADCDFTLVAAEHSTYHGQLQSAQVLLEIKAEWRQGWRPEASLFFHTQNSAMAGGERLFQGNFEYTVSVLVFSMQI